MPTAFINSLLVRYSDRSQGLSHWLLKYWKYQSFDSKIRMLLIASLSIVTVYVISPTITYYFKSKQERQRMFNSKRKDKFTTGFINTRNDCFANSSIQAFASLPQLNSYLNQIMQQHHDLTLMDIKELPSLPLHFALATVLDQLQEQVSTTKNISVWPFLKVIENIFNSKISTSQNDAHELVSLILETLENEVINLRSFLKKNLILNFKLANLPFNGLQADQLTCLSCGNSSTPSFHSFSVFSLPVPQLNNAKLVDMLKKTEQETITGYNCLTCKINAIMKIRSIKEERSIISSEEESKFFDDLSTMKNQNVPINYDLPPELELFVKNYQFDAFVIKDLTSTIVKKTLIVQAPDLLTIHLSRSMFTGQFFTRNGCRVEFNETLNIKLDEKLLKVYNEKAKKENHELLTQDENITYRLRSVIRHQGTHNAGHYECFRHKPNLVKDLNDKVWNLDQAISFPNSRSNSNVSIEAPLTPPATAENHDYDTDDSISSFSKFRNKFIRKNSATSINSNKILTPSSNQINLSVVDENTEDIENLNLNEDIAAPKYKKILTVKKYPYWRISDTQISEVKAEDLLKEESGVYMLYYEKLE